MESLSVLSINLGCCVSNLSGSLSNLGVVFLDVAAARNKILDNLVGSSRTARLGSKNLAFLVNHKHTTCGALRRLLQANCRNECLRRVAEQAVRQILLSLEGGVRLGAVVREAEDAETSCGQRRVRVAEKTDLCGTCKRVSNISQGQVASTNILV